MVIWCDGKRQGENMCKSRVPSIVFSGIQCQSLTEFEVNVEWPFVRPDPANLAEPDYMNADILVAQHPFQLASNDHLLSRIEDIRFIDDGLDQRDGAKNFPNRSPEPNCHSQRQFWLKIRDSGSFHLQQLV